MDQYEADNENISFLPTIVNINLQKIDIRCYFHKNMIHVSISVTIHGSM